MGIRRALCLLFFATKMAIETAIFTLLGKGFWGLWFCLGFFCWVFAVFFSFVWFGFVFVLLGGVSASVSDRRNVEGKVRNGKLLVVKQQHFLA